MQHFISSLYVEGFKSLHQQTIPFRPLTVLAGANSVGKSSVIQCFLLTKHTLNRILINLGVQLFILSDNDALYTKIPLHGDYLLALGNTNDIISRKSSTDKISFQYRFDDVGQTSELVFKYKAPINSYNVDLIDIGGNEYIRMILANARLAYLNAERVGPRQHYDIGADYTGVGYQGEYTISVLSSEYAKTFLLPANKALNADEPDLRLNNIVEQWMQYIIPGITINAQRLDAINKAYVNYNGKDKPYNVGFGISYVLPIVVAGLIAKEGGVLIVENPEAHLHPLGQSRIGEFLAKIAASGVQVIVETHSEHITDGMQLAVLQDILPHNDLVINFFKRKEDSDEIEIQPIYLNEMAELSAFPRNFFDQTRQDIVQMIRLRRQKTKP